MAANEPYTRRNLLKVGATIGAVSVTGCTGLLDDEDGVTLVITGGGGDWQEARRETVYDPWLEGEYAEDGENPHTFDFVPKGYGARMTEIRAEQDDPPWDLMSVANVDATALGQELGVFRKAEEHVPNWENVGEGFKTEWHAGDVATVTGLVVNENHIDPDEINSWLDLMHSDLEGRVPLPDWGWLGSDFLYVMNYVNGGSLDDLEPGLDWLEGYIDEQDPTRVGSMDEAVTLMETEELHACMMNAGRSDQIELQSEGDVPTQFIVPEEGATTSVFSLGLLNNRPEEHLEPAADIVNAMLMPESAAAFAEARGMVPTIPEAFDFISEDAYDRFPTLEWLPDEFDTIGELDIDWGQVARQSSEDADDYRQVVGQ